MYRMNECTSDNNMVATPSATGLPSHDADLRISGMPAGRGGGCDSRPKNTTCPIMPVHSPGRTEASRMRTLELFKFRTYYSCLSHLNTRLGLLGY
jgi:hypothetical protein